MKQPKEVVITRDNGRIEIIPAGPEVLSDMHTTHPTLQSMGYSISRQKKGKGNEDE